MRSNLSEASALSRAEFDYDDPSGRGNLTARRSWDSTKGVLARPLSTGTYVAVSHQYDTYGNRRETTDAQGVRSQIVFGLINGFTDLYPTETRVAVDYPALKRTSTQEYDFWTGLTTRATDVDNNVSSVTTYDVFGRPTLVKAAEGKPEETRTATEYSDSARRVIVRADLITLGEGKLVSIQHYDQLGRVCLSRKLEDAAIQSATDETQGIKVQTRYRFSGTNSYTLTSNAYRAATSGAAGSEGTMGWTRTKMDKAGRVVEVQTFGGASLPDPWGTNITGTGTVISAYDADSVTVTDQDQPTGKKRKSVTDGLGRLKEISEDPTGLNYLTSYNYDALDNLTQVTQSTQPQRSFVYSSLKRLISATNPESGTISYQYDNNGNLTQKTDARPVTITYAYDELNRNTTVDYSDTSSINPDITRIYDGATNGKGRFWHNYAGGNFTTGSNVEHTAVDSYDALGRPLIQRQLHKLNGAWGPTYQTQRAYNRAGGVTSQTYPSGRTVSFAYDTAGRLNGFTGNLGDGTNRTYSTGIIYSPLGGMTKEQFGTDTPLYNKSFYNSRGQLSEIRVGTTYTGPTDGGWERGAIINHYSNQCWGACNGTDNNGNLKKQDVFIPHNDQMQPFTVWTQEYDYDSFNRLQRVREGTMWQQEYVYDRWGNRTIHQTNTWGTGINKKEFTINTANNRLGVPGGQTGVMTYDNAGNLTTDTYTGAGDRVYDAENRMTKAWGGNNRWQEYTYNADGQRVRRKVDGVETWQVYGMEGELLAEYGATAAASLPQKEYGYRNGQLLITAPVPERVNVAAVCNGATASASSVLGAQVPAQAINGDHKGLSSAWWTDDTSSAYPDWIQVDFAGSKTINEIDVYGLQQNPSSPVEPTLTMTSSVLSLKFADKIWQHLRGSHQQFWSK